MESTNLLPVLGILVLAVVVVVVLLRFMRARRAPAERHAAHPKDEADAAAPLTKEQQEYLDSSHILPGGRDALGTRADAWRDNKRK